MGSDKANAGRGPANPGAADVKLHAVIPTSELSNLLGDLPDQEDLWTNLPNEEIYTDGLEEFFSPEQKTPPAPPSPGDAKPVVVPPEDIVLVTAPPIVLVPPPPPPVPMLRVEVTCGRQVNDMVLRGQTEIGRHDPNRGINPGIPLQADQLVSRRHAEILLHDGRFFLVDVGSSNGTRHNRVPVAARTPTLLQTGDLIELGDCSLIRVLEAPE